MNKNSSNQFRKYSNEPRTSYLISKTKIGQQSLLEPHRFMPPKTEDISTVGVTKRTAEDVIVEPAFVDNSRNLNRDLPFENNRQNSHEYLDNYYGSKMEQSHGSVSSLINQSMSQIINL